MRSVEARLQRLDSENRARKASYPVAGSLVGFVADVSQVFTESVTGGVEELEIVRIRFTPDKAGEEGRSIIRLYPEASLDSDFSTRWPGWWAEQEPQAGDGTIVVRIGVSGPEGTNTFYIRVTAAGSSEGTFTKL